MYHTINISKIKVCIIWSTPQWLKFVLSSKTPKIQQSILLHSNLDYAWHLVITWFFLLPKKEIGYEPFRVFSCTISKIFSRLRLSKIFKIVRENTLKGSKPIIFSDNNKILLTTRNVRLNRGHYATKYQS